MWHTVILHGNSKQYEEEEVNIMPWKRLWDLVKIWTFKKVEQEEMLVIFFFKFFSMYGGGKKPEGYGETGK